ncbi:uncharacterized protein Z520_05960 [Fonsecaea multimorphosa CBS 102226]|uniref:AB hydrolase-1 domain-containing protein n=1 Tax=Fonsecaea multimorphosa CBS 102226 TaxID=1442371 RepID=A0A0D2K643_9EURO|nr:uncharacterized protein Z520_05960 [Fonsecaea multimorphosa CBS 102226]KIX98659.1 hypothetical protein Z520_05960 [Fonsecaea multimorphosa CBS 102226]OAL24845.1 hypothetical protein AYO22_05634 [Fonsecaea multimorphosa]
MVLPRKTLRVSHLGGIQVGYRPSREILDHSKPTLVLFNPFTTTADYYLPEFENEALLQAANLIALEPLGHGHTFPQKAETYTYWDTAIMTLQALDKLGVEKVFAAGTSQGGFIAARMALLAPERIQGIIAIGSSMDSESPRSRDLGCWDGPGATSGLVTLAGDLTPAHDFEPGSGYCDFLMDIGFGKTVDQKTKDFWAETIKSNYSGDSGKRRICQAAVNLAGRDGLHERLPYIRCPVLWLQGTDDVVFSVKNAEEEIKLFTNATEARLVKFSGGVHFLSWTHKEEVARELLGFISKWERVPKASL